ARPLLLVFDDLHWADRASLLLLRHVANTLPGARICLLGTYRDAETMEVEGLRQLAADTARLPSARLIELQGLSESETERLLAECSALPLSPDVAHAVHSVTEGNPFFVHEIVRALASDGQFAAR